MSKREKIGYMALGVLLDRAVFIPIRKITLFCSGLFIGMTIGGFLAKVYPEVLKTIIGG